MKRVEKGFTLIELLIVVAIIAILAAIAVPNFLEAQTRAKISRVKADMRSMGTALGAYAIDENTTQKGVQEWRSAPTLYAFELARAACWPALTTPISYMTTIPLDPFYMQSSPANMTATLTGGQIAAAQWGIKTFWYERFNSPAILALVPTARNGAMAFKGCVANGIYWSLESGGPVGNRSNTIGYAQYVCASLQYAAAPTDRINDVVYDPTNGTMSRGGIYYTNKGFITQREKPHMNQTGTIWIP